MAKSQIAVSWTESQRGPKTNYQKLLEARDVWEPRFWPKVEKSDGCWNWTAGKNNKGYGVFGVYPLGYKKTKLEYAHRVSFIIHKGELPLGYVVDHKCRNHACVNPSHLAAVPHSENCKQGSRAGVRLRCNSCNAKRIKDSRGGLTCRHCALRRSREHRQRKI